MALRLSLVPAAALSLLPLAGCEPTPQPARNPGPYAGSCPPGTTPTPQGCMNGCPPGTYATPQGCQQQSCAPGTMPSPQGCVPAQQCPAGTQPTPSGCQTMSCPPGTAPGPNGCVGTGPAGPGPIAAGPDPLGALDPINRVDLAFLRSRSQAVIAELTAALPPEKQSKVQGIPLVVDDTPGEVNAFASCSNGQASMAITDGLMQIQAQLASARATDEVFGGDKTGAYIAFISRSMRPKAPIPLPPATFYDPLQQVDRRKIARQAQIYDEQVGYVLGHELAHHYLGHLPCTNGGNPLLTIGRMLSNAVPVFNQPNELGADVQGVKNVLLVGQRKGPVGWTEGGALLTLRFFGEGRQLRPADLILAFELSHPAPQLRAPVVQQTANQFRSSGGRLPL